MALKYESVAKDLEERIRAGIYRPRERIPTVEELCEAYGVSRITVRRSLDMLEESGLVVKRRGAGTFVKDMDAAQDLAAEKRVLGFSESARRDGCTATTRMIDFTITEAPAEVARRLRIEEGEPVYHITRVRHVNADRGLVAYTWIPVAIIPRLTREQATVSIYHHVEVQLGLTVGSTHRQIRAVRPTPDERRWLGLPEGEPLLEIDQTVYLSDGRLFEYSVLRRDTRAYSFNIISKD